MSEKADFVDKVGPTGTFHGEDPRSFNEPLGQANPRAP